MIDIALAILLLLNDQNSISAVEQGALSAVRIEADDERRSQPLVAQKPERKESAAPAAIVRRDLYGDPLPAGALVRLGTTRFRHGGGGDFLPDGTCVSYEGRGHLAFWDVRTGRLDSKQPGIEFEDPSLGGEFRLLPDGKGIVTLGLHFDQGKGVFEQLLQCWTGGRLSESIKWVEPQGRANTLECTPDGTTIVTGSTAGELRFWDRATGTILLTQTFPDLQIESIAFSADGEILAVAGRRGVYLWEWLAGKEPVPLEGLERGARAVAFSPDGRRLATGSDDNKGAKLWDVKTRRLLKTLQGSADWYYPDRIAFTSSGQFLAVPTGSHTVELWDVSTGQLAHTFGTGAIEPRHVAISPDDRWLVASGTGPFSMVWDLETRKPVSAPPGHESHASAIEFTPDGKHVITGSDDHTIRIWNAETGKQEHRLQHEDWVREIAVSPNGKLIASNSLDDTVGVWEVESGQRIYRLFGHGRLGGRRAVAFSPDGTRILSWGDNMALRTWDVETGKALADTPIRPAGLTIPEDENGEAQLGGFNEFSLSLKGGTFTPDGQRFVLAWGRTVSLFGVETGKELRSFQVDRLLRQFSCASRKHLMATSVAAETVPIPLATGGQGFKTSGHPALQIRSSETGEIQQTIPLPPGVYWGEPAFSPDDRLVAVVPPDPEAGIPVFDVESGRLRYRVTGFPARPFAAAFSPDGSRLATAHYDTTVLIWDLREFRVNNE